MMKMHQEMQREGKKAAGKAQRHLNKALVKKEAIKAGKPTHPGGRRPGDRKK
jgi:hypothetical protein